MSRQRKKVVRRGGGIGGKIVALLVGFILGIVGTIGGIVGGGYYLASNVTIKDAVGGVEGVTGTDIDYSQYITEEYAEKTLIGLIGSIGEVASEFSNGTGSLSTLEQISPYVRTVVEQITASTEEYGVSIDAETLMTTPFAQLADFATQTMNGIELGKVLQTVGFETSILKLLCYGEEGVNYEMQGDEIVMLGSNKPLTVGALTTDAGIEGIMSNLSLAGLMESLGSVDTSDSIMRALLFGKEGVDYEMEGGKVEMKPIYFRYNASLDCFMDDTNSLYTKTSEGYKNEQGIVIQKNTVSLTSSQEGTEYDYCVYDKNGNLLYELKTPVGESENYFAAYKNDVEQKHRGLTMGDLTGGKDLTSILETLAVGDLLVSDPSNADSIQLALAYGQKDLHYTILPNNTIQMLPMQIAVTGNNAYDGSGTKLNATVTSSAGNHVVKITDGKTYYLSASLYPKDDSNNQKTLPVGDTQAPLYYAAIDTSGTLEYYAAHTIGSFLTGDIFSTLLNSLTISDILGGEITEDDGLMYAIKDWKISNFMDSSAINSLKLSDIIAIDEGAPAALKAISTWTIGDLQNSDKFNSLKIGDLIEVKTDSPEILKTLSTWTIADLKSSSKFDTLKVGDLIQIDESDANTSEIIKTLSSWTIADLKSQSKFDELYIKDLMSIDTTSASTPAFMKVIAEWQLKDLKNKSKFDTIQLNQLIEITESSPAILKSIADWTIADMQDKTKFDSLQLGKLFAVTESSPAILKAISTWTLGDMQDKTKFDSLQIGKLFDVTETSPAILKAISTWTIGDMQNQTKFDELYLKDLMTIDTTSASTPAILKAISTWTLGDMQDKTKFDSLQIGKLFDVTETSPAILKAISTWTIGDMQNQTKFDELYIKDLMTIDTTSASTPAILKAIANWQLKDMKDQAKFDNLYIKDLIAIDEATAPTILLAIKEWQLKDMRDQTKFDSLTLVQVLGEDAVNKSDYFRTIGNTPISGLSDAIDGLSINDMFEDTIYRTTKIGDVTYFAYSQLDANGHPELVDGKHVLLPLYEKDGKYYKDEACTIESKREFNGVWHYLLQDPANPDIVQEYTFEDLDSMISNMTSNIQHATLNDLVADDIVDLGSSSIAENDIKTEITIEFYGMTRTIPIGEGETPGQGKIYKYENGVAKQKMGELTINEMIEYLSDIFAAISELESFTYTP